MNYFVASRGHIAFFEQSGAAWAFAAEFGGDVFNLWGLLNAAHFGAQSAQLLEPAE
jgi:hypothetical protein